MPKQSVDKVMQFVEEQVKKDPRVSSTELYEQAKKLDSSIGKLTVRQFHAKYPLVAKRKLAPKKPRKTKAKKKRTSKAKARTADGKVDREAVRKVLLQFAKDLATADSQAGTIDVLAGLDKYVEKIEKASG